MFYSFNLSFPFDLPETDPATWELKLCSGVIHQVDILFPSNPDLDIHFRLLHRRYHFIPTNRDEWLQADNTIISTREFYELQPWANVLSARIYNTNATDSYTVTLNIGILPRKILQPFSFDELLKAALGGR